MYVVLRRSRSEWNYYYYKWSGAHTRYTNNYLPPPFALIVPINSTLCGRTHSTMVVDDVDGTGGEM